MKDKNGKTLVVGDYVLYEVSGISQLGKIKSLEDPWGLDMYDALIENLNTHMPIAISKSNCIEKLNDEQSMLYKLEGR